MVMLREVLGSFGRGEQGKKASRVRTLKLGLKGILDKGL